LSFIFISIAKSQTQDTLDAEQVATEDLMLVCTTMELFGVMSALPVKVKLSRELGKE